MLEDRRREFAERVVEISGSGDHLIVRFDHAIISAKFGGAYGGSAFAIKGAYRVCDKVLCRRERTHNLPIQIKDRPFGVVDAPR